MGAGAELSTDGRRGLSGPPRSHARHRSAGLQQGDRSVDLSAVQRTDRRGERGDRNGVHDGGNCPVPDYGAGDDPGWGDFGDRGGGGRGGWQQRERGSRNRSCADGVSVAVAAVTNEKAFTGGLSEETDEELRQRILDSFQRLPNGANAAWYELTACRHEGVAAAKAVGKARGAGTVDVYVSAPDGIPSEKLLTELQTVFQKSREIAVNVQVKAPTAATVNVAVTVKTAEGTDFANVKTAVEADLAEQFNGKLLGRGVKLAELNSRIYAMPGVENCHITAPAADLAANDTVLPVLGTVTVTEEA